MKNNFLKVKELVKNKELTLNDLSPKKEINKVNMNYGYPTVSTLNRIAKGLNVLSIRELYSVEEGNVSKELKWDTIKKEFVFSVFDENVSFNATFNKVDINFSLRIKSKDLEIRSPLEEKKEFFDKLLESHLDIREFLIKDIVNGTFTIHILSVETEVTLLELESIVRAIHLFRYSYLSEQYCSYFVLQQRFKN